MLAQSRDALLADSLERQLKAADLIVINKTDLADVRERLRVRERITTVIGPFPTFETAQAVVPLPLLIGIALNGSTPTRGHD